MPRGDGTGPLGGQGRSSGIGRNRSIRQAGGRMGMGQGGFCICPQCGKKIPHAQGVPCNTMSCPSCHSNMVRE